MPPGLISVTKTAARAIIVSTVTAVAFFAVALLVPQDRQAIRRHIVEAIQNGEMASQMRLGPFTAFTVYRNVYDCSFFQMMLAPPPENRAAVLSNSMMDFIGVDFGDPRVPGVDVCQILVRALPEIGGSGVPFLSHNRYILGEHVVGALLLSIMSVATMKLLLLATSFALLAILALTAFHRYRRSGADPAQRAGAAGYGAIALCLALFYGAHYFDASLNFSLMDDVQYVFLLISLIWPLGRMRDPGLAAFAASYGCLIAIFEFLTGGIPLALALLPLMLAFGYAGERSDYLRRLAVLWGAFCVGVVTAFALKKLYTIAFVADADAFVGRLMIWIIGSDIGVPFSLTTLATSYAKATALIAWGSGKLGTVLVTAGAIATLAMTFRRTRHDLRVQACWLAFLAIAVWYVVFLNHTMQHAVHMVRLFVIPIITGTALLAIETASWREQR